MNTFLQNCGFFEIKHKEASVGFFGGFPRRDDRFLKERTHDFRLSKLNASGDLSRTFKDNLFPVFTCAFLVM